MLPLSKAFHTQTSPIELHSGWQEATVIVLSTVKLEKLQNKGLKDINNNMKAYIGNIEITWVPESAPLGISKTKSLYDAMVRQSLFL